MDIFQHFAQHFKTSLRLWITITHLNIGGKAEIIIQNNCLCKTMKTTKNKKIKKLKTIKKE